MTDKIKYSIQPVSPKAARNRLKDAYAQMTHDISGVHEPFLVHSPSEDVLLGLWSVYRESLLAKGQVSRGLKETITASISEINRCPWCLEAHTISLYAVGAFSAVKVIAHHRADTRMDPKMADLIAWAHATRSPKASILQNPPFSPVEAPEIIGTAFVYHYLTRVVNTLLVESFFPPQSWVKVSLQRIFGLIFIPFVRRHIPQCETLNLLPPASLPSDFEWAKESPGIAGALARFVSVIEASGQRILPLQVRQVAQEYIHGWEGEDPGLSRQWVEQALKALELSLRPLGKVVLLAAIAPHHIDEAIVADFRRVQPEDAALIEAVAWGSFTAARRIGSWLYPADWREAAYLPSRM